MPLRMARKIKREKTRGKRSDTHLRGTTASVLEALATTQLSSPAFTSASTKIRLLPARRTPARQSRTEPDAGRRKEVLFSTVNTSRSSPTVDAAAPTQV